MKPEDRDAVKKAKFRTELEDQLTGKTPPPEPGEDITLGVSDLALREGGQDTD